MEEELRLYTIVIPRGRYILVDGLVLALQELECTDCGAQGPAYVHMGLIDETDHVQFYDCPVCHAHKLILVTYRERER